MATTGLCLSVQRRMLRKPIPTADESTPPRASRNATLIYTNTNSPHGIVPRASHASEMPPTLSSPVHLFHHLVLGMGGAEGANAGSTAF